MNHGHDRFAAGSAGHDTNVEKHPTIEGPDDRNNDRNNKGTDDVRARFERLRATGDPVLREQLIIDHRWIATQCARRFRFRGEPELDLVQVALVGLVKATDRFDPAREVPFHAYAIPTILGELKRHFRDTTWTIGVPRSAKDLMPRLRAATELLHQRLGRSPTVDELAVELSVDRELVVAGLAARGANRTRPLPEWGTDTMQTFGPLHADSDISAQVAERVAATDALAHLDPRSRKIMVWRFYDELTQREIGERLGIGQVQVSRLLRSALHRMRTATTFENGKRPSEEGL